MVNPVEKNKISIRRHWGKGKKKGKPAITEKLYSHCDPQGGAILFQKDKVACVFAQGKQKNADTKDLHHDQLDKAEVVIRSGEGEGDPKQKKE